MPFICLIQNYELDFSLLLKIFHISYEYYEQMVFRFNNNRRNGFKLQSFSSK